MSDGLLPLSPASPGGQVEDVEDLTGAGGAAVVRQRVQVTGAVLAEVARVLNIDVAWTEYGLVTRPIPPRTATPTNLAHVLASASAVLLMAANPARKGLTLQTKFLPGGGPLLYVRCGPSPTTDDYDVILYPGSYYELPDNPLYTGEIWGIWDGTDGFVNACEKI